MTTNQELNSEMHWGRDLTILCPSNFRYLPGVYALFNSAILNGFLGQFLILVDKDDAFDINLLPAHPQLGTRIYQVPAKNYHPYVRRLPGLQNLQDGKYLYLDADMIIERPCGHLFKALDKALVVSAEPESKYDQFDVLVYNQAEELGLSANLKPFSYVNGGLLGFNLPLHREFIEQFINLSLTRFADEKLMSPINWFFLDQCMLSLLIRQPDAPAAFAISPRQLEFGYFSNLFQDRPFPWTEQGILRPADQTKFIIHGAGLSRPWLKHQQGSFKGKIASILEDIGILGYIKKPRPYERAWAYYACGENLPIPHSAWTAAHSFRKHKNPFWRSIYGL